MTDFADPPPADDPSLRMQIRRGRLAANQREDPAAALDLREPEELFMSIDALNADEPEPAKPE